MSGNIRVHDEPREVRWGFEGARLGRDKFKITRRIRDILLTGGYSADGRGQSEFRFWVNSIRKIVVLI